MRRLSNSVPVAVLVLVLVAVSEAVAQTADPEARPTRGVHLPAAARAGDADATAVQLNPAQLGLLPAGSAVIAGDFWRASAPLSGRGGGLYLAAPLSSHAGIGWSLSHVAETPRFGIQPHTVMQLGLALRLGRAAALGASWAHVWGSSFAGADTFDLGLSLRAGRHLALGFVVEDVNEPTAFTAKLPRLWVGELVLRPLGTGRLELAVGAAHAQGDQWRWIVPRGRIAATLTDGLRLLLTGETLPRGSQLAFAGHADYQGELALAVDLDHTGLTAAARAGFPGTGGGDEGGGASLLLRFEGQRRAPLAASAVVVRFDLDHVDDDTAFLDLVRRLRAVGTDRGVAAVLLRLEDLHLGLGRIEELRDLVAALRARGKRVYAYGAFPSTRAYYLATACDAIVLHPAGQLSLTGFSQTVTFYKHAMDTLGVNVDLVRIAEFKGAMEPFVFNEQSAPVRENKNALLDDVFQRLVATVARARSGGGRVLDEARVRMLVDRGLFTPIEAQLVGLVDAVKDDEELEAYLRLALGRPGIAIRDPDTAPLQEAWPSRRVAVIMADGSIVDGKSHNLPFELGDFAGSDTLIESLEECRRDPSVSAIVLRVNSPGGSAFASDVIAREIAKVRRAGKPVVVSMGDIAASGGYYISAPADVIFAEPSTLSGSIGIFGYKVDVRKLMGTLGVSTETYRRGLHADYLSPYRPWTDEEIKIAAEKIRHFYELFLTTIVEGRRAQAGLTRARVDEIGRGHVWTGAQARGLGLVDRMGGLSDAIDLASQLGHVPVGRADLPDLVVLPRPRGSLLGRLAGVSESDEAEETARVLKARLAQSGAAAALRLLAPLLFSSGTGFEARMPYDLEIR
jgi:protease-4